jgi:hypothetical protein
VLGAFPGSSTSPLHFNFCQDFLSRLSLGLVLAQLYRLPAVDANNVVV